MSKVPEWATLTEGEQVVWTGGPSGAQLARSLLWSVVFVVAGLVVASLGPAQLSGPALAAYGDVRRILTVAGFVIALLGLLLGLLAYLRYESVEYLVTTEELYVKRGFLSRSVRNLRLDRVQDSGFTQSAGQRLLGYGDVHVSTAGGSGVELTFENVPDPAVVNGIVTEQLDAVRTERGPRDDRDRRDDRDDDAADRSRRDDRADADRGRRDDRRSDDRARSDDRRGAERDRRDDRDSAVRDPRDRPDGAGGRDGRDDRRPRGE